MIIDGFGGWSIVVPNIEIDVCVNLFQTQQNRSLIPFEAFWQAHRESADHMPRNWRKAVFNAVWLL